MNKKVKIGELNFEFSTIGYEDGSVSKFEIENDASMVFEIVNLKKAIELRDLLNQFIDESQRE